MTRLCEIFINGYNVWGTGTELNPVIQNTNISVDSVANLKEYQLTTGGSSLKWLPNKSKKISFTSVIAINGKNAWNPFGKKIPDTSSDITADDFNTSEENLGIKIYESFVALANYSALNNVSIEVRLADLKETKKTKKIWEAKPVRLTNFDFDFKINGTIEFKWEFTENTPFTPETKTFNSFNYKNTSTSSTAKCAKIGWKDAEKFRIGTCLPKLWNKGKFYYNNKNKAQCTKCVAYWQYYIINKKYKGTRVTLKESCKKLNVKGRRIDGWWDVYTQKGTVNYLNAMHKKQAKIWKKLWANLTAKKKEAKAKNFLKFLGPGYKGTKLHKLYNVYAYHYSLLYCKGCTIKNKGYTKIKCK